MAHRISAVQVRIGLQNKVEMRRSLAWFLDYPGCFAYGADGAQALLAAPRALLDYAAWVERRSPGSWMASLGDFDVRLVETFENYVIDEQGQRIADDAEGYEVDAWFKHDRQPLTAEEVERARRLLAWTRADLLAVAGGLSAEKLAQPYPGERWSLGGILGHIGGAEWWYLTRLGLSGMAREAVPAEPFERMTVIRARLLEVLPSLVGSTQVTVVSGETWSPRKVLRRALWHERDHTEHIIKLL